MGEKRKRQNARGEQPAAKKSQKATGANNQEVWKPRSNDKKPRDAPKAKLTFLPRPDWHAAKLPELAIVENAPAPAANVLDDIHRYADMLLEAENTLYESSSKSSDSSHKFMSQIMSTGTLEDKVSALTLLVQESPVHTRKAFENLLGLAGKRSRNQALMAVAALKDLLGQGVLLPPDRKLRAFNRQPALLSALKGTTMVMKSGGVPQIPGSVQKVHLISWAYEDWLKKQYFELLKIIETWCNDEVEYARSRSVTFVYELLREKPEQEDNLLRLLVNKLGDTDKKIASRASYLLLQLQNTHPMMKGVIVNAIESEFMFRPGQTAHAKYYAIITLNQTILSTREQDVADKLLEVYFKLFVGLIKNPNAPKVEGPQQGGGGKPGKMAKQKAKVKQAAAQVELQSDEKLIAQVLSGVNRAFPYAKTDDATFEGRIDVIFRITHSSNFNTSLQALTLLQQISATKHASADRFYRTLYESLLDPRLIISSKHILYLNLLYKSLKADVSIKRVQAFVKRLLQVVTLHEPPFICGVLYLISELINTFPSIKSMLNSGEERDDDDEKFVDVADDAAPAADGQVKASKPAASTAYDGRKRDPAHANADRSCLWELLPFLRHFHPSVSLFATRLLEDQEMPPKPDPTLHTLMHFLDRFSYRNPKANAAERTKGTSIFQPIGGAATADRLIKARSGASQELPFNSEAFYSRKLEDVPVDSIFFHSYFEKAGKTDKKKAKKSKRDAEDDEEDGSEEEEIWKALVASKPDIEMDDEDDDDIGFDEEDMESDGEEAEDDGGVELNLDSDDNEEDVGEGDSAPGAQQVESDEDDFDAAELEDGEDAFVSSDEELPSDFEEPDEEPEIEETEAQKRKKSRADERKKKKKLKQLPTFASVDDYAKLLGDDDDDEDY